MGTVRHEQHATNSVMSSMDVDEVTRAKEKRKRLQQPWASDRCLEQVFSEREMWEKSSSPEPETPERASSSRSRSRSRSRGRSRRVARAKDVSNNNKREAASQSPPRVVDDQKGLQAQYDDLIVKFETVKQQLETEQLQHQQALRLLFQTIPQEVRNLFDDRFARIERHREQMGNLLQDLAKELETANAANDGADNDVCIAQERVYV